MSPTLTPLEDVCISINSGGTPSRRQPSYWDGGTIPWIKTGELNDWKVQLIGEKITEEGRKNSSAKIYAPGTVLIAMYGDGKTITTMGIVDKPSATNQACCALVADPQICDPLYLFYALKDRRSGLLNLVVTGAQRNLSVGTIRKFPILMHPLKIQRRIAGVLSAYDNLIELNRQRIFVLEEIARKLFAEWFIRRRFPGHEDVGIEDTPDGPLPTGWSWGAAGDLLLFDPRTRVPREGEKTFIPMGSLDTATSLIAATEVRTGNSGAKFQNGDTLFARITPCLENGKTGLVRNLPGPDGVGFGSTEFIVMRKGRVGPAFTYCLSRLPAFREHARMSMSGATGRQRARTDSVASFPIAIPPTNYLFEQFEKAAWPMLELVGELGLSGERLAAARDLLLPRLISGQLSLAQAERELEAA